MLIINQRLILSALAALILILLASAAPSPGSPIEVPVLQAMPEEGGAKKPVIDVSTKALAVLYRNQQNPIIQQFSLRGELATQWAAGTSDRGSYGSWDLPANTLWDGIDVRRWRLGFESKWFNSIKLWGTIDINPQWDPFYKDIYELAASFSRGEELTIGTGKIKARYFSQEYNTRNRELIVFERSLLVNTLRPQQLTAAWINGKAGNWVYALAAYAGDYEPEFSRFDAGAVIQASLGYDFASVLKVDKALVKFDYQESTSSKNSDGPGLFSNAFSLNTTFQNGCFYGYTDILGGIGRDNQGNVWGVTLTPTYFLILNKLQAVLRYQYAHGDNDGIKLQNRYEALAPDIQSTKGAGSDYNAIYLGLIYYIYRHNFKLMTGVEYNDMTGGKQSFSGWTYLAGVRLAF
jgi:phosphate-selective porin OprO/OprP